jgi:hypothetical protein
MQYTKLEEIIGKTMKSVVNNDNEEIVFTTNDGEVYKLYHGQDCCESVTIESITGDLSDLVGSPIFIAEESTNSEENPENVNPDTIKYQDSFTWTFYKFSTFKGYVDIRWYGESNGYYSESVSFCKVE